MGKKYLTFSFDDGLEQDKRIIRLMKYYGLKGTFNLNSGMFGLQGEVMGIGSFAFRDCEKGVKHRWPFSYVPHDRIPEHEIPQVYAGMEIATHGFLHEALRDFDEVELNHAVGKDKARLEQLTGRRIVGHAYAKGSTSKAAEKWLKDHGYLYARGVMPSNSFAFPDNMMNFRPTSSVISKNAMTLAQRFVETSAGDQDLLLFFWGHGYEMDYGKGAASWESLEQLFAFLAGRDDIVYCTNSEAFLHG